MWIVFVLLLIVFLPEIIEVVLYNTPREMRCVKVIRLTKLRCLTDANDLEQRYYIKTYRNKAVFAFKKGKKYIETYEEKTVKGKIKVYQEEHLDEPVLKIFQKSPVFNCGAFTSIIAKTEYQFYVPKEAVLNIDREFKDKQDIQIV